MLLLLVRAVPDELNSSLKATLGRGVTFTFLCASPSLLFLSFWCPLLFYVNKPPFESHPFVLATTEKAGRLVESQSYINTQEAEQL